MSSTLVSSGFKIRVYPDAKLGSTMMRWIGCQEFIYTAKVREDRYYRRFKRKALSLAGEQVPVDQQYSRFISDELTPWLREVPSHVLRNGAVRFAQAYQRFFKGLGGRPQPKNKHGRRSVWLTSELFRFVPAKFDADGVITAWDLVLGTKKFPCGTVRVEAQKDRPFSPPASIHVSIEAGRWHVSFCNEIAVRTPVPNKAETAAWLMQFGETELLERTCGGDRGVAIALATNAAGGKNATFDLAPIQKKRLAGKERQAKRWQRIAARRVKGSNNRRKANARVARCKRYGADLRQEFAHQTSHALAKDERFVLYVFEDLQIKNMSASAKGTTEAPGKGVAQKAGLNRSILSSAWGKTALYLDYKAQRRGKLFIKVPPHHSSQECSHCGHTHPDNRADQARFVCTSCGHTENADTNAAKVLAKRGVRLLLAGAIVVEKPKKRCSIRRDRNEVGQEVPEPLSSQDDGIACADLGKSLQPTAVALWSPKQETPTATERVA